MPLDAVANFVRGATDAALDNSQTTVSVNDASIFPDPSTEGAYNIVVWDDGQYPRPDQDPNVEIVRVTARDTSADELTVTRAEEGTAAAGHPSGSAVQLSPTAKMFSDIESEIDAAGSLTDSGADNPDGGDRYQFPQSEDSMDLQGGGDIENAASVSTGELNHVHWLDPYASDFGAELEAVASNATAGDTIMVPPVDFAALTGASLSKPLHIKGFANATRANFGNSRNPVVSKEVDDWVIQAVENTSLYIEGLYFDGTGFNDTQGAIKLRGNSYVENVVGDGLGGHVVYLAQETTNDNLNLSQLYGISGKDCSGDVVRADNTSGGNNNINSIRVWVQDHFNNTGWAVNLRNTSANGSITWVNSAQGSDMSGVLRFASQACHGRVMRHEGAGPVVDFVEPTNHCEVIYDNTGNGATWTNNNNSYREHGGNGTEVTAQYGDHTFGGTRILTETGEIAFGTNGARIRLNGSGELVAENEAGTTTQLTGN